MSHISEYYDTVPPEKNIFTSKKKKNVYNGVIFALTSKIFQNQKYKLPGEIDMEFSPL